MGKTDNPGGPGVSSDASSAPKTAAAIPCYNEARFIEDVVTRARRHVDLVIVVDDCSTDATATLAEKAGALVVRHKVNQGKGIGMNTAFAKARELGVENLVLLDGDGQHDPDEIPVVLKPVLSREVDVCIGSRFLNGHAGIPFYRTLGQRMLTLVANVGTGMTMTDTQCGFRAFSRRAVAALHFDQCHLGCVESEMQFLIKEKGLKATEVPVTAIYLEKAKRNPIMQGLRTLSPTLRMALDYRPMPFLVLGGALLLALGLVLTLVLAAVRGELSGSSVTNHWSGAVAVAFVIVGLFAVLVGSLADRVQEYKRSHAH